MEGKPQGCIPYILPGRAEPALQGKKKENKPGQDPQNRYYWNQSVLGFRFYV